MSKKFLKKTERNPARESIIFVIIVVIILIAFIYTVKFYMNNAKPYATSNQKQLNYLDFKMNFIPSTQIGEKVKIEMSMKNISDKEISLDFPYSSEVDFQIYREDNWIFFKVPTLVWSSAIASHSIPFHHVITLKPGQSKIFTAIWDQTNQKGEPVKIGDYNVIGKVVTSDFSIALTVKGRGK